MKITAIIQARMGSSRLPGKTLAPIAGQPLLLHVLRRAAASQRISEIVVATTTQQEDDAIVAAVGDRCRVFRGSVNDVLDRYYQAACQVKADPIIRITADDPLKDPAVIDRIIDRLLADATLDYASNTIQPSYPEGLDVEAFRFAALERAWREATRVSDREHVTPFIWRQPEFFKIANVAAPKDWSHLRWTIDYEQDLAFARAVYERLGREGRLFGMQEILDLLEREPQLAAMNAGIPRHAGYAKSLADESQRDPKFA